jgi:hypothetical protein
MEINPSQLREPLRERVRTRFGFIGFVGAEHAPPAPNKKRLAEETHGARNQAEAANDLKKVPKT